MVVRVYLMLYILGGCGVLMLDYVMPAVGIMPLSQLRAIKQGAKQRWAATGQRAYSSLSIGAAYTI